MSAAKKFVDPEWDQMMEERGLAKKPQRHRGRLGSFFGLTNTNDSETESNIKEGKSKEERRASLVNVGPSDDEQHTPAKPDLDDLDIDHRPRSSTFTSGTWRGVLKLPGSGGPPPKSPVADLSRSQRKLATAPPTSPSKRASVASLLKHSFRRERDPNQSWFSSRQSSTSTTSTNSSPGQNAVKLGNSDMDFTSKSKPQVAPSSSLGTKKLPVTTKRSSSVHVLDKERPSSVCALTKSAHAADQEVADKNAKAQSTLKLSLKSQASASCPVANETSPLARHHQCTTPDTESNMSVGSLPTQEQRTPGPVIPLSLRSSVDSCGSLTMGGSGIAQSCARIRKNLASLKQTDCNILSVLLKMRTEISEMHLAPTSFDEVYIDDTASLTSITEMGQGSPVSHISSCASLTGTPRKPPRSPMFPLAKVASCASMRSVNRVVSSVSVHHTLPLFNRIVPDALAMQIDTSVSADEQLSQQTIPSHLQELVADASQYVTTPLSVTMNVPSRVLLGATYMGTSVSSWNGPGLSISDSGSGSDSDLVEPFSISKSHVMKVSESEVTLMDDKATESRKQSPLMSPMADLDIASAFQSPLSPRSPGASSLTSRRSSEPPLLTTITVREPGEDAAAMTTSLPPQSKRSNTDIRFFSMSAVPLPVDKPFSAYVNISVDGGFVRNHSSSGQPFVGKPEAEESDDEGRSSRNRARMIARKRAQQMRGQKMTELDITAEVMGGASVESDGEKENDGAKPSIGMLHKMSLRASQKGSTSHRKRANSARVSHETPTSALEKPRVSTRRKSAFARQPNEQEDVAAGAGSAVLGAFSYSLRGKPFPSRQRKAQPDGADNEDIAGALQSQEQAAVDSSRAVVTRANRAHTTAGDPTGLKITTEMPRLYGSLRRLASRKQSTSS